MLDLIGSKGKFFSMPFDNQLLYDFFLNYTYIVFFIKFQNYRSTITKIVC